MSSQRRLFTPALALLAALATAETPVKGWRLVEASADGAALSMPGYGTGGWIPAVVPGTVLTSTVPAKQVLKA